MKPRGIFSMPTAATRAVLAARERLARGEHRGAPDEHAFSTLTIGMPVWPSDRRDPWPAPVPAYMWAQNSASTSLHARLGVGERLAQGVDAHLDGSLAFEAAEGVHPDAGDDHRSAHGLSSVTR